MKSAVRISVRDAKLMTARYTYAPLNLNCPSQYTPKQGSVKLRAFTVMFASISTVDLGND